MDLFAIPSPPVSVAPPPWTLVGDAWWLILGANNLLVPGSYDPLEGAAAPEGEREGDRAVKGPLSVIMVLRYTESPVGPYDELIWVPGAMKTPSGKYRQRITRIYVSSRESTYCGRVNWNIPKHLARFSFTKTKPELGSRSPTLIEVFPAAAEDAPPFFSALATPSASWLPSLPFSNTWVPSYSTVAQPPLPASPTDPFIAGTDKWTVFSPVMRGSIRIAFVEGGGGVRKKLGLNAAGESGEIGHKIEDEKIAPGDFGDGVGFPNVRAWSTAVYWLPGLKAVFGEPAEVVPKGRKPKNMT